MIKRFEDEYPETRQSVPVPTPTILDPGDSSPTTISILASDHAASDHEPSLSTDAALVSDLEPDAAASDDDHLGPTSRPVLSRHNSDVSIAGRALALEEGRMHRFGQQFRRDILRPESEDHLHATTGTEIEAAHLAMLRAMIEELGGEEVKKLVEEKGARSVIEELAEEASVLRRRLVESDPEAWAKFREAWLVARRNGVEAEGESAIME